MSVRSGYGAISGSGGSNSKKPLDTRALLRDSVRTAREAEEIGNKIQDHYYQTISTYFFLAIARRCDIG